MTSSYEFCVCVGHRCVGILGQSVKCTCICAYVACVVLKVIIDNADNPVRRVVFFVICLQIFNAKLSSGKGSLFGQP
jgi:hypothetical protein